MFPNRKNRIILGKYWHRQNRAGHSRPGNHLWVEELEDRTLYAAGVAAALVPLPRGVPANDGQPVAVILRAAPLPIAPLPATTLAVAAPAGPPAVFPAPAPAPRPDTPAASPMLPEPGGLNGDRGLALNLIQRANMDPVPGNPTDRSARTDLSSFGSFADPGPAERIGERKLDLSILGYDPLAADVWNKENVVDWLPDVDSPLPLGAPPSPGLPAGLELLAGENVHANQPANGPAASQAPDPRGSEEGEE